MSRSEVIPIRVSQAEKDAISENAARAAMNVSDFMRARALGAELPAGELAIQPTLDEPPAGLEEPGSGDPPGVDNAASRALPNAIQLSNRTGLPKATCQRMLDRGELRWRGEEIEVRKGGGWLPLSTAF